MSVGRWARGGAALAGCLLLSSLLPAARAASVRISPPPPRGAQVGFAAGETGSTKAYTPAVWRVLASTHSQLFMDLVYGTDFGTPPKGKRLSTTNLDLIRHANRLGVTVSAWLTFPLSEGTFADEENAQVVASAIRALHGWVHRTHVRIHETLLDLEQATGYQPVADALAGHLDTLERTMHANVDPAAQCRAMVVYRNAISWAHRHGMRVTATPVPFALDDVVLDHNMGLSDVLDIPGFVPGMYDEVYLQAYRAEFGIDLGSAYIVRYYRLMQHYFGKPGQVILGNTGDPPYTTAAPLIRDIRMLAGLGATSIPVFDFDSAVKAYGVAGLRKVILAGRHPLSGSALLQAEHSSQQSTTQGNGAEQLFSVLNQAANVATAAVTPTEGGLRAPNAWPSGCGSMRVALLRN